MRTLYHLYVKNYFSIPSIGRSTHQAKTGMAPIVHCVRHAEVSFTADGSFKPHLNFHCWARSSKFAL